MEKCLIVAVSDNGAIGVRGDLPWHLSEDLKFFKRTTMGCPVIMGRTTFESIGRPLPGRLNIVLTGNPDKIPSSPQIVCANTIDSAFAVCQDVSRCFIIGGASVYAKSISLVDKLYITHVHTIIYDADAFFPPIDSEVWAASERSEMYEDVQTGWKYEFVTYTRKDGCC